MSVGILGTSWDQCRSMVQYSFTSTETRRLVRTDSPGRPPRLSRLHSSWTMKTAALHDELMLNCPQMSADILGTSCDQCRSTVQSFFTSTETRRLVRTDSSGRPPRLSHSSWTMPALHWLTSGLVSHGETRSAGAAFTAAEMTPKIVRVVKDRTATTQ